MQSKSVSVVLPCYNEEFGIARAVEDFFVPGIVDEIVVVDNNSRDRSAEIVRATRARLVTEKRQGYGHARRGGLAEGGGDYIVLAEADGTFTGRDILKLLVYADDFDVVLGTRTTPQLIWNGANMGLFLRYGNWIVAQLTVFLFNTPSISDCGCTMRLFSRRAAALVGPRLTVGGSHLLPETVIVAKLLGLRMIEVPVHYGSRLGESKITGNLWKAVQVGLNMIGLILRYRVVSWLGLYKVKGA